MTISMVVLFGIALLICLVKDNMSKVHAFIAVMFGLYLGGTAVGPALQDWTEAFMQWISQINF
jgi:hypothetical protein